MWLLLPGSHALGWEPPWGLGPTLLRGNSPQRRYSSCTSAAACGSLAALAANLDVTSVNPWLYGFSSASLRLVIEDDFYIISL